VIEIYYQKSMAFISMILQLKIEQWILTQDVNLGGNNNPFGSTKKINSGVK